MFPLNMRCLLTVAVCAVICGCEQGGLEADGVFHGNVEDRDLRLSFVESERIAAIIPEEGAAVKKGDLVATLETVRFENEARGSRTSSARPWRSSRWASSSSSPHGSSSGRIEDSGSRPHSGLGFGRGHRQRPRRHALGVRPVSVRKALVK